jgi:hypothetical protein
MRPFGSTRPTAVAKAAGSPVEQRLIKFRDVSALVERAVWTIGKRVCTRVGQWVVKIARHTIVLVVRGLIPFVFIGQPPLGTGISSDAIAI